MKKTLSPNCYKYPIDACLAIYGWKFVCPWGGEIGRALRVGKAYCQLCLDSP